MPRLFIALRPDAETRARLTGLAGGVAGARWQTDDQLHLTVRFVGNADPRAADDLVTALDAIDHPPVPLTIKGAGVFAKTGRIHTLYAGVEADASLLALVQKVERACQRAGFAPETRAFLPHITLARGAMGADAERAAAALSGLALPPVLCRSFALYQSLLGHSGAVYEECVRFPLFPAAGCDSVTAG